MVKKVCFRLYLIGLIVIFIAYCHDYADIARSITG